jgi:hypothetical protein
MILTQNGLTLTFCAAQLAYPGKQCLLARLIYSKAAWLCHALQTEWCVELSFG